MALSSRPTTLTRSLTRRASSLTTVTCAPDTVPPPTHESRRTSMPAPSRAESTHSIARGPDEGGADSGAVCCSMLVLRWRRAEFDDDAAATGPRTIPPIGDLYRRGGATLLNAARRRDRGGG